MQDLNAAPINPLPWIVWAIGLPMIALEVVLGLSDAGMVGGAQGVGWRLDAVQRFAFAPDMLRAFYEAGVYPLDGMMRLLTYPFVHGTTMHAVFVIVILLALGKMVGEVFRWWAVLVVFFGSAVIAALVFTALLPGVSQALYGGYPPVYGLIGAFTFLLWVRLTATGGNQYRAFSLIGMLLGVQLLFAFAFGGGWEWVADIAGFVTGFLLSFVVSPGGWAHVMARLRNR